MIKKRGEFSFVWIFALIAGGAILFFAIYGALKVGDTQRIQTDSATAKELTIITNPLQAGFAEGAYGSITFAQETRINNDCLTEVGGYGRNTISVATKSGIGKPWNQPGIEQQIYNKYLFSTTQNTGTTYYVFSKQFKLPYKIADLTFITTRNYCFIGAPEHLQEEITGLGMPNIQTTNIQTTTCNLEDAITICFGSSGTTCDIRVRNTCSTNCEEEYDEGIVYKNNQELTYTGSLLFGALFSEEEQYECNVERLLFRTSKLAELYQEKTNLMDSRDCESNLGPELNIWAELTKKATQKDLPTLNKQAKNLEQRNTAEVCGVW